MAEQDGKVSFHVSVARDVWDDERQRGELVKDMWRRLSGEISEKVRHPLEEPTISIRYRSPMHGSVELGMSQEEWDSIRVTMSVTIGSGTSWADERITQGLEALFRRLGPPPTCEAESSPDSDGEGRE